LSWVKLLIAPKAHYLYTNRDTSCHIKRGFMSDAFQEREKGFERKFQLDQDQMFKVASRRDKLFGQWLAGKLGLSGPAAEQYAKDVVGSNFEKPGDDDMLDKVRKDLADKKVIISDTDLLSKLNDMRDEAARQILGEGKK
jgi:hypothetical protein